MRSISWITCSPCSPYLSVSTSWLDGEPGSTVLLAMKPSSWRMCAMPTLRRDAGIFTVLAWIVFALRMRVIMSAIGSVIMCGSSGSPRGLAHARDLALVRHAAQADAADAELLVDGARPPAERAARVAAHLELRFALGLDDPRG